MAKKKIYKSKDKVKGAKEPTEVYQKRKLKIFSSFEEQSDYELAEMAALSGEEILRQMRLFINIAYGMHGYDHNNLPKKHFVKILTR